MIQAKAVLSPFAADPLMKKQGLDLCRHARPRVFHPDKEVIRIGVQFHTDGLNGCAADSGERIIQQVFKYLRKGGGRNLRPERSWRTTHQPNGCAVLPIVRHGFHHQAVDLTYKTAGNLLAQRSQFDLENPTVLQHRIDVVAVAQSQLDLELAQTLGEIQQNVLQPLPQRRQSPDAG